MNHRRRYVWVVLLGLVIVLAAGIATVTAQPAPLTLRLALVSQFVVNQHRTGTARERALVPEFRTALDRGVVDRVVLAWQRGLIQRRWSLVWKPVRVLAGPDTAALGGRGQFELVGVRPAVGAAAWTHVDVAARTAQPDDILLLEVGGETSTLTQVLATLLVGAGDGALRELPLHRVALIPGDGIQVVPARFGLPVEARYAALFRSASGLELLVVRSPLDDIVNGTATNNGPADVAPGGSGDWREGDRLLLRVPLATLRSGMPSVVLGWKDRVPKPEGGNEGNRPLVSWRAPVAR